MCLCKEKQSWFYNCAVLQSISIVISCGTKIYLLREFFSWNYFFHDCGGVFTKYLLFFWWKYLATLLRAHGLSAQNQQNKLSFANIAKEIAKFTFILEIVIFESSRKIWKSWKRNLSNPRFSWTSWIDVKEKWIWFEKESEDVRTVWSTKTTKSPNWKRVANANSWNTVRKSAK